MGDGISHIRDTLLGLNRIAASVPEGGDENRGAADVTRSSAIRADIASLNEYESHLSNKVQFLLDATLGFINIEQNDIVRTLTLPQSATSARTADYRCRPTMVRRATPGTAR
jgi:magnesium transporter